MVAKSPQLSLLVLRVSDLARSRAFYATLGLTLTAEKHENGPLHYSTDLNGTVLELYPTRNRREPIRIGLRLATLESAVAALATAGFLEGAPSYVSRDAGTRVCVVRDPDGNTVELSES